jgi:hypothetical protein
MNRDLAIIKTEDKFWAFTDLPVRLGMSFFNQLNKYHLLKTDSLLLSTAHKSLSKKQDL